ncbi:glycosyltransferase family 4 protein [Pseudonocardia kongjuensis]|uniref:glycosyltransferase family 4 protein n=1 Tax=Pseudonocardia kongjuensis TaxID=102227 RepID=UPI0031DCC66F
MPAVSEHDEEAPLRIAVIRTSEVPEGCGTASTASALAVAGHRVLVLTDRPGDHDPVGPVTGPGELEVRPLPAAGAGFGDDPPDLVHAVGPAAVRWAAGTGAPVVASYPTGGPDPVGPPAGAVAVLADSEHRHAALLAAGVPRSQLRTVPACVDTDVYTAAGPALRRGEHPRLVLVGSLAPCAGAGTAIRALARVRDAELLVAGGAAGDDPDRDRLFAIAREAGVTGRVRFLGPVGDALRPRLLRSADVVLDVPGRDVPVTPVLQAMACARPVVGSSVGGSADAVVDRVTGLLVRPGRPADVAAAVRDLLADEAMRAGYGIAGRDRAVSRFDRARIAVALTALYGGLVGVPPETETETETELELLG